jgi:deoxyadenosine/deoxycytidine kinase
MEQTALERLKTKYIFSIEGNIGSGKTTVIHHLQRLYGDQVILVEEPVKDWQNLEGENLLDKKNKDLNRWGYSFEAYVLITKMNELTKVAFNDKKIILIERCMLTDKVFFDLNVENGLSNPMEEAMFKNLYEFLSKNVYPKLSGIIYLDTPVDECIHRMILRGRKEEKSITKEYLQQLDDNFKKVIKDSGIPYLKLNGLYDLNSDLGKIDHELMDFIQSNMGNNASTNTHNNNDMDEDK